MSQAALEALARLRASTRPRIAFLAHAFGGGVGRHIADLAAALGHDAEIVLVQPYLRSFVALRWLRPGEDLALWFSCAEWPVVEGLLESLGVERVHFHHVHGLPRAALDLPARLGCAHDLTLHDYFPACPNYHLTGGDGRFCGGGAQCHRCLDTGPAQWPITIDAWRESFAALLATAQRVIAPSHDAARRLGEFFPQALAVVWPHPEEPSAAQPPLRVVVPGAISPEKGLALLEACVADAARRKLPLHFRVLGYTARPIAPWPELPYSVAGEYPEGGLAELLAIERGDVAFFPAQVAETFSYTLSACLATGMPIVATDLGALPERLAGRPNARIVAWTSPAGAVNDALLASVAQASGAPPPVAHMGFDDYRKRYMEPVSTPARAPSVDLPRIEPRWLEEPTEALPPWSLAALFDDAVGCGRASSRELLRRKTREADLEIEQCRGRAAAQADPVAPREGSPGRSLIAAPLRAFARLLRR